MGCRKILVLVCLVGISGVAKAQLEEKTLQTMLDQITALNAYAAAAADGYRLVESGWHTVGMIRQGEWDLHKGYYGSLLKVSQAVRGMAEVGDILKRGDEAVIGDLAALLVDGQVSMTDGERMRRIIALGARLKKSQR